MCAEVGWPNFRSLTSQFMVSDCFPNQTACLVTSKVADRREDKRNRVEHFEVKCFTAIDEEVRQFSRDELLSCAESVEIYVSIVGFKSVV